MHANLAARFPRIREIFSLDNGIWSIVLFGYLRWCCAGHAFTGWLIIKNGSRTIAIVSVLSYCLFFPFLYLHDGLVRINPAVLYYGRYGRYVGCEHECTGGNGGEGKGQTDHDIISRTVQHWHGDRSGVGSFFAKIRIIAQRSFAFYNRCFFDGCWGLHATTWFMISQQAFTKNLLSACHRPQWWVLVSLPFAACLAKEQWRTGVQTHEEHCGCEMKQRQLWTFLHLHWPWPLVGYWAMRAVPKYGDKRLMVVCGLIATVGLSFSIAFTQQDWLWFGFFFVGLGLSVIIPIAYSIAGNSTDVSQEVGLAMVTTVGYTGFYLGRLWLVSWPNGIHYE